MSEEAHALVLSLLAVERDAERRAKLIALQLALGYPHALEVEPGHLDELRAHECAMTRPAVQAQVWLGSASAIAFVWWMVPTIFVMVLGDGEPATIALLGSQLCAITHAVAGALLAWRRPRRSDRAAAFFLAGMGLVVTGAAIATMALLVAADCGLLGLLFSVPSLFVSLAALSLARHSAP